MDNICELCIIWDDGKTIQKEVLLSDTLYNIDNYVINKKYNSSEDIRNDKNFKLKIDNFLRDKKLESRNYRGNIVIMNGNEKIRVMYIPRINLIKNFVKIMVQKMNKYFEEDNPDKYKDKEYTKSFIKKYPHLFKEEERMLLYTGLKYNKKTLYQKALTSWKKRNSKVKDNTNLYNNMRKFYKYMGEDIKKITYDILDTPLKKEKINKESEVVQVSIFDIRGANYYNDEDNNELDGFDEEIKYHLDEGLRITHVNNQGEIIGSEKYSDYLERESRIIDDIEEERKRLK